MARARKSAGGARDGKRVVTRMLIAAGVLAALVFAVQGGEYGTRDLMRQRSRRAVLAGSIDSLQHLVDSLKRYKRQVETDPALQERLAREEFGLVRGEREVLYRFVEPEAP